MSGETGQVQRRERDAGIVRVSIIGIAANLLLAGFKAAVGLLSNSIAIVLDAVNNLSDAFSSIVTIVGTKLANRAPDKEHPYGHGRTEYIATTIIAAIVIGAGVTSLQESIARIIAPETATYSTASLVIVAVAVGVKFALGTYVKRQGRRLRADALIASGTDAFMDAVISASTLAAAFFYLFWGISLEAWLGAVISLVIVKAGVDILRDAISKILGERVDADLARSVKQIVESNEDVHGAYDLILHDYGPERYSGSVHVEVDENLNAREIDKITREVQMKVLEQTGVLLHTIGVYSCNSDDDGDVAAIRAALLARVAGEEHVLQVHGFYVDETARTVNFDLVIGWEAQNRKQLYGDIVRDVAEQFPDYRFNAVLDSDISD